MGLAGRKQKQRIPADPRNLSWADDASRFGLSYLSKFGWDASKGLGSSGDGMKTHLKVQQKLDIMGIGGQHQRDPNGIAWKQNKEYEALLKRLNESAEQENRTDGGDAEGECARVRETALGSAFVRAQEEKKFAEHASTMKKKRKHEDADENARKKRKKEKKEKRQKASPDDSAAHSVDPTSEPSRALSTPESHFELTPCRPMAHRARIRAAKRIAGKSASAIAEILGIAPSLNTSASTSTASTPPTSASHPSLSLDNLTTSTKSVADYFKEKLLARSSSSSSPSSSSASSGFATPGLGAPKLELESPLSADGDEVPRRGIGSPAPTVLFPSQMAEAGSASAAADNHLDGESVLTEKQRRKAERKSKKRKRREAEASEGVSVSAEERVEGADTDRAQGKSKNDNKRREGKAQALADESNSNDDDDNNNSNIRHAPRGPLPEPREESQKEHRQHS